MNEEREPLISHMPPHDLLLWIIDAERGEVLEMSSATVASMGNLENGRLLRTLSFEEHLEAAREVVATGEQRTLLEWVKLDDSWHKLVRTKVHLGDTRVLETAQDITQFDPRAEWLARINLETQRLELDSGQSISYDEFVVLHLLVMGLKYKQIAMALGISTKTVEYRLNRMKIALEVESTKDMMLKVTASGLIHLAMVPIDVHDPAQDEVDLYRKIPN